MTVFLAGLRQGLWDKLSWPSSHLNGGRASYQSGLGSQEKENLPQALLKLIKKVPTFLHGKNALRAAREVECAPTREGLPKEGMLLQVVTNVFSSIKK